MALSQGKFQEASLTCRRLLGSAGEQYRTERVELKRILGLAQIRSGNHSQGVRNCEEAFQAAAPGTDLVVSVGATLAIVQARTAAANWKGVLAADEPARSVLAQFPESNWIALALAGHANQALGRRSEAQKCALDSKRQLDDLSALWGKDAFQLYLSRPDIQTVWRLLQAILPERG
jgi:hypothetical protein